MFMMYEIKTRFGDLFFFMITAATCFQIFIQIFIQNLWPFVRFIWIHAIFSLSFMIFFYSDSTKDTMFCYNNAWRIVEDFDLEHWLVIVPSDSLRLSDYQNLLRLFSCTWKNVQLSNYNRCAKTRFKDK